MKTVLIVVLVVVGIPLSYVGRIVAPKWGQALGRRWASKRNSTTSAG